MDKSDPNTAWRARQAHQRLHPLAIDEERLVKEMEALWGAGFHPVVKAGEAVELVRELQAAGAVVALPGGSLAIDRAKLDQWLESYVQAAFAGRGPHR